MADRKRQPAITAGRMTEADMVQVLTEQLRKERDQRIMNLRNAASIMRVCSMGLESSARRMADDELIKDTQAMLGLIVTIRSIMEDEITVELAKVNAVSVDGMEALH